MTTFTTEDRLHAGNIPLTTEQIEKIVNDIAANILNGWKTGETKDELYVAFARAIERAHGIGNEPYESDYLKSVKLAAKANEEG